MIKKTIKASKNDNYILLALKSTFNDYKVVWKLNSNTILNLAINSELDAYSSSKPIKVICWLNLKEKIFLKDLSQFNFLFKIFNNDKESQAIVKSILDLFKDDIVTVVDRNRLTKKSQAYIDKLDF